MSSPTEPTEPLPGLSVDVEISDELRAEAARDMELAASAPFHAPEPGHDGSPPKLENPFASVMSQPPAFLDLGGGAQGAKEGVTAGTTMEAGSVREFAHRATLAVCLLSLLCGLLGIGCLASPWFGVSVGDGCVAMYSTTAYGFIGGCPAGLAAFPTAFNAQAGARVQEAVGTLGFAAFLMATALLCSLAASAMAGLMSYRLARGLPPHRWATAFQLTALTAIAFTTAAVAMMTGSARLLLALNEAAFTPVVQAGHGAGDAMVVFLTGVMLTAVVVKIRVRAKAVTTSEGPEREELEALLGAEPEGHFCL